LESYINTDKVIYKPNDVMFIEVLVLDAFNKTPIGLDPSDSYFSNFMFQMEIYDPSDNKVYDTQAELVNSTIGFTYKIPSDASGGEYKIKAYNY